MNRSEGFALVLVIWVLSILTIMAGSFALSMKRESTIISGNRGLAQAIAIAESGLVMAQLMLMHPNQPQRWHTDGSIYQIDYTDNHAAPCVPSATSENACSSLPSENDSKMRIQLLSETGKIDLNNADQTLLQTLFRFAPIEEKAQNNLVSAILDWRDEDDLIHIDGAEKKEYQAAGLAYGPRNKPFQSIEELQLVLGMNEALYQWLENLITVHSGESTVDLTQASKTMLHLLSGLDPEQINQYIAAKQYSAANDLPIPAISTIINQDASTPAKPSGNAFPASDTDVTTTVIGVTVEVLLNDGITASIQALIKRSDESETSPFQILKWQNNPISENSLFSDENNDLFVRQYIEPEYNHRS